MKSLEEQMAEAFEGKFFWERTTRYDDMSNGLQAEIRRVQKKFAAKPPNLRKPLNIPAEKQAEVDARVRRLNELPDSIKNVKDAILNYYNATESHLEYPAASRRVYPARPHFIWAVMRYNPWLSLGAFGEAIGKHHTTILYHRNVFEEAKEAFKENIAAIDAAVGYRPG
jgi:chromosomal replication initiation ATPase DnaA